MSICSCVSPDSRNTAFNNFLLKSWVSWNGLKSKNISGRSSYTRHLNYYVSEGMTACVREVDMSPCSYVLFILELEAIINYLGARQAWTHCIRFTPVATLCSRQANPFNSYFISVQSNLLMIVDIFNRYQDMIKAAPLFAGLQLDHLWWLQGRQNSEAEWRSGGDGAAVKKQNQTTKSKNTHLFFLIATVCFWGTACYTCCQIFSSVRARELGTCCLLIKWERRRRFLNPTCYSY